VNVFSQDLENPRIIAVDDNGVVCVGPKQVVLDRDVNLLPTAGKNDQDQLP